MKKRAFLLLSALTALAIPALLLTTTHVGARPRPRQPRPAVLQNFGEDLTQRKIVWASSIPVFDLDVRSPKHVHYGAHYPLVLAPQPTESRADEIIQQAKAAGINGFALDTFTDLTTIRPFYAAADRNHFLLAPCFDLALSTLGGQDPKARLLHAVEVYCREAAAHPGCARQNGAFVAFMYNNASLTPEAWADVRSTLKNEGLNVYWVGDVSVNFNWVSRGVPPSQENVRRQTLKYFPTYDAGYSFLAIPDKYWDTIYGVFKENHKPFAGAVWPGYYRGVQGSTVVRPFGYDALGTALYRGYWQRQIDAGLPWTHVTTWNDFTEHTNVSADTSYNVTRYELTAWYAAQFKGAPLPFHDARLYVTTPQALYRTGAGVAEALVLNPTSSPVRVSLRLTDNAGAPYGSPASGVAPPHGQMAVSLPLDLARVPGHFLRAHARMGAEGGETASAPILIYDGDPPAGNRIPPLYYSIPASHALPGKVTLSISNGQATLGAPAGVSPRFLDLLHDQNIVKSVTELNLNAPISLDEDSNAKLTDDNYAAALDQDHGLYVERVIDSENRVGYSDPVYLPAAGAARRYAH